MKRITLAVVCLSMVSLMLSASPAAADPACTITGTTGNDSLTGTTGNDVICGLAGNDRIWGLTGQDYLIGGPGDDRLFGNEDSDTIQGNDGADYIEGGKAKDTLFGGGGNDTIHTAHSGTPFLPVVAREQAFGQDGDDYLVGAEATLFGNAGNDVLNFCGTSLDQAFGNGGPGFDIAQNVSEGQSMVEIEQFEPGPCPG